MNDIHFQNQWLMLIAILCLIGVLCSGFSTFLLQALKEDLGFLPKGQKWLWTLLPWVPVAIFALVAMMGLQHRHWIIGAGALFAAFTCITVKWQIDKDIQ